MKNSIKYILLVIVIAGLGYYATTLKSKTDDTPTEAYTDFEVKDTASVYTIKISDTEENEIKLSRKEGSNFWFINDSEFKARPEKINLILETFHRIKIKQDIPEQGIDNVLTTLSVRHKKVEIYKKGEDTPFKTWYIGNPTADHMGTYMLLKKGNKKSTTPFITYKPGVYGSLDVRFFTSFQEWRYTGVFTEQASEIKSVNVKFGNNDPDSYTIKNLGNKVALYDNLNQPVSAFDSSQVKHYLTHFKNLHFETADLSLKPSEQDSIFALQSTYEVTLKTNQGKETNVQVWKIKMPSGYTDDEGNTLTFNPDRAWARINGMDEVVKIQYYTWDVVFKPLPYFIK